MCLALNKIFTLPLLWRENTVEKRTEKMYEPKDGRGLRCCIRTWHNHNQLICIRHICQQSSMELEGINGTTYNPCRTTGNSFRACKKALIHATTNIDKPYRHTLQKVSGSRHRESCKIPEHEKSRAVQAIGHLGRGEEGRKGRGCYCVWCLCRIRTL